MSSRPPPKKPSGSRPNVRKLLSKDSFSSLASFSKHGREASEPGILDNSISHRTSKPLTLPTLNENHGNKETARPWMKEEVVSSPVSPKHERDPFKFDEYASSANAQSVKRKVSKPTLPSESSSRILLTGQSTVSFATEPSRSSTSSPPPVSPSRVRWDQLRQHVLPSSSAAPSPDPSFTSFSQLSLATPVPTSPRPSRFAARFGFRQVVNEAREAADDITRRFAEDLQRACRSVRFGDSKPPKPEREATQASSLGSTLHLPFMSSTSLPLSANMSSNNLSAPNSFRGLRTAPSTANLASNAGWRTAALSNLQSIIARYASVTMMEKSTLPLEKEVLSALLVPFLSHSTAQDASEERQMSLEIFELIVRRWKAPSAGGNIDRCLWCCKAATAPASGSRTRLLYMLNSFLSSGDSPLSSPPALLTILPNIALLVSHCQTYDPSRSISMVDKADDLAFVHDLIKKTIRGDCGQLDTDELEQTYQALFLKSDSEDDLRAGLCIEALARCLEFGMSQQKRAMLRVMEKYWPSPDLSKPSTPLRSKIHLSKINSFLRPVLSMLQDSLDASKLGVLDYRIITQLLTARVLPEIDILTSADDSLQDVQYLAVRVTLTLLGSEVDDEEEEDTFIASRHHEVRDIVLDWLNGKASPWQEALHKELKGFAASADWKSVISITSRLLFTLPENSRKIVVGMMIPQFQERIVDDFPGSSNDHLSRLLASFAVIHPQVFYKPLFVCAASVREETVAHQLAILVGIEHYMPNFWTSDAEMVSVALMSDPGGSGLGKGKAKEGQTPMWGKARLGQTLVLLELVKKLKNIREEFHDKRDNAMGLNGSIGKVIKFVTALEARLAILIEAKEQIALLPLSQRILFTSLFLEIRLLTRSLKPTAWLARIISWTMQFGDDPESQTTWLPSITEDLHDEIDEIWTRLDVVYSLTRAGMKPASQRRNTTLVSPKTNGSFPDGSADSRESLVNSRIEFLDKLPKDPLCSFLAVLVALSGALKREDYARLGSLVWDKCLNLTDTQAVIHACFVCMQCAEKAQDKFIGLLLARLQSPIAAIRRTTLHKLGIISNWRFRLLSVTYITDRNYRRPFKLARPPLNFVATDIGDNKYITEDDLEEVASGKSHALPLDIRRRLNEIGWDDEERPIDQQLEWRRTPMSLLSSTQIDHLSTSDAANDDSRFSDQSPSPSPTSSGNSPSMSANSEGGLVRRNSSSHGRHAGKRRPVFVQPLIAVFLPLAKLALDSDFSVASMARDLIIDYMRDDPSVLCRPVMDILSENVELIDNAVSTLRTFLQLNRILPPRLTHHTFNHLAGFLKLLAKDPSTPAGLHILAQTVPSLAKFAPQVSEMSVRAIRRGKIEIFLFPSGSLYFPESAPPGSMFPKSPLPTTNPFESYPKYLVDLIMIRMSQNMLFVELLKRHPQDVHVIRKNWTPLVLPDVTDGLDDNDVVPRRSHRKAIPEHSKTGFRLSLSFSRTHLLFVAQVFRCLTRHLNAREELAMFLDGVNSILLRHGDDIGIVAHALIVYMIASTRFRRLMSSTGFTIFLPTLIKVYCEAEGDPSIREAIEYAFHRFFAIHEEVFVYQALQVVSSMVSQPAADGAWISSRVYHLLSTLKAMPLTNDAAGIRDVNRDQEEETALVITADERPQMFLASLRSKENKDGAEKLKKSLSVEIFDKKRFHPDNVIRMLLTVIAHDHTVRRAQYFVRLFRYLVPDLYDASTSARNVLKEAVEALGSIMVNKANKAKGTEVVPRSSDTGTENSNPDFVDLSKVFGNLSSPCDLQVMRSDFLFIFAAYVRCGGAHRDAGLQKALEIVKILLRESSASPEAVDSVRLFLEQIGESFSKRQDVKYAITLLKEFAIIIRMHGIVLDLSGLLKSLVTLCSAPTFANDKKFSSVVVTQICSAALEICEMAAQENILSDIKFVPSLITLLAHSVCLFGSDVVGELERRDPSPAFLTYVVLPFIFQLRTTAELATQTQWTDSWRQDAHAHAWVRLLSFALATFQNQHGASLKTRGSLRRSPSFKEEAADPSAVVDLETTKGSIRKARRRPSGQSNAVTSVRLAMAFITLKAVILRGEEDISTVFPGAWLRVAAILRSMLRDGNAMFALRLQVPSAPPSPALSPMSSTTFTEFTDKSPEKKHKRSSSTNSDVFLQAPNKSSRPSSPTRFPSRRNSSQQIPCPRIVDYLTWSMLEFLCLRRSPLCVHLRTYMYERVVPLNDFLQSDDSVAGEVGFRNFSRRKSVRPISTIYTRPRYRSGSTATTPDASPRLGPSDPGITMANNLSNLYSSPGYTGIDYNTPTTKRIKGRPPTTHLGISAPPPSTFLSPPIMPASTSADSHLSQSQSVESVGQNDMALDAREALALTVLRSPGLVQRTFERIRIVQRCLGYNTYLPIPEALTKPEVAMLSNPNTFDGGTGNITTSAGPRTTLIMNSDEEPEVQAWTKRKAAMQLMTEAEDLLRAWQVESGVTASGSDTGHKDGPFGTSASAEGNLDARGSLSTGETIS
ncbi:hypothetical protein ACEPAH_8262 [Sanghuangporus vaninii]